MDSSKDSKHIKLMKRPNDPIVNNICSLVNAYYRLGFKQGSNRVWGNLCFHVLKEAKQPLSCTLMSGKYLKSPNDKQTHAYNRAGGDSVWTGRALICSHNSSRENQHNRQGCLSLRDVGAAEYYIIAKRLENRIRDFILHMILSALWLYNCHLHSY